MESNWRYNVWHVGQSQSGLLLVARLLHPIGIMEWIGWARQPPGWRIYGMVEAVPGYVTIWTALHDYATPGFPKEYEVLPD